MQFPSSSRLLPIVLMGASILLSGLATIPSRGDAPRAAVSIDDIRAGFDGVYKVGEWSPLFVTVTAATDLEAQLIVEVPDVDADMTILTSAPVALSAGVARKWEGKFKTGRIDGPLRIRIESAGKVVAEKTLHASPDSSPFRPGQLQSKNIWAAIGEPAGLGDSSQHSSSARTTGTRDHNRVIARITVADLPSSWRCYAAIDTLILATAPGSANETPLLKQFSVEQNAALREWVRQGGHLVLSVGSAVPSYQESPLARWIPVVVTGQAEDRQLSACGAIAGGNEPLPKFRAVKTAVLDKEIEGIIVKRGANGPTLVRVPYGFGQVTFLTIDLNRAPVKGWKAANSFLEHVVEGSSRARQRQQKKSSGQLSGQGVSDLTSQFHAIQQDIPGVGRVSIWTIMGLTIVYLLMIGPFDYWVVHRILKRPELTWVTFPLLVAVAGALAIWTSSAVNGNAVSVKQTNIVDIDAGTERLLVRSWIGLYSPKNARYEIGVAPGKIAAGALAEAVADSDISISWSGMAEDRIGGLNRRGGGIQLTNRSYRYGAATASLEGIPISQWSARNFVADWTRQQAGLVTSTLESPAPGRLRGYVSHALSVPLEDCLLAFGSQVYQIEKLAPHQQWSPSPLQSRDLRSFLNGTTSRRHKNAGLKKEQFFEEITQYDPLGRDAETVARMLTFHQSAGGTSYTGMMHDVLPELDLTNHLKLGNAVLFAKAKLPAIQVLVDGVPPEETSQETFIRIMFRVEKVEKKEGIQRIVKPVAD